MLGTITNNEIKKIRSLANKKSRDELGLFVVEGEKMVSEARKSSFQIEKIYYRDEIGDEKMTKISSLSSPSPVLAVVKQSENLHITDEKIDNHLSNAGLFLALDAIRDPGNLGTIIRVAEWFGIDAIYASEDTVDLYNPKVVQATMGAIFRVRFHYCNLISLSECILKKNGSVYGTFLDGENMYNKDLNPGTKTPSLIVIGNESNGISENMSKMVSDRLYIPPYPMDNPGSESLNAAIATAITVAEFRRRCFNSFA